jgi:AcrR family transcriptional regulator
MSAPRTARERVHQEMSSEILTVARAQLAQNGAAALSLRSIARQLEMAPSALYRYYPGRDALLSALILSAYGSLADTAERASQAAYAAGGGDAELWAAVPRAMRQWALAHPHEWGLIFGTPVPGYQAPQDTVVPYGRVAVALVRPVVEARAAGRLAALTPIGDTKLHLAVAPVTDALFPDMPTATVVATLQAWTTLVGAISLELFGHWRNTVLDPERFFEQTLGALASSVGLR